MKAIRRIFVVLALLCATQAFAEPELDKDYTVLKPAQPTSSGNKIEVLEFFAYPCPHCFHLHPFLSEWEKNKPKYVEISYVPATFNPNWVPMAYTYYSLELLGKQKQLDDDLYNAWNDNNILVEESKIADFVAQHGVDRQRFSDLYHSFSVESKVTRSKQMQKSYKIMGTPTLVVEGKYVIINKVRNEDTIRALDEVVAMARKEHAGKH